MPLYVNFRSVVHALSDSLDLMGIDDALHGKRVGIMAVEILRELGWSRQDQEMVFDACLLHDIGVSTSDLHRQLVEEFDWIGSQTHAKLGAFLLSKFPPLAHLAPAIRLHHTHWSELKDRYGKTERIANLIFLADRVDVLAGTAILNDELLEGVPAIRAKVLEHAGRMFDPELVAAFVSVSRKEAFWLGLESGPVAEYMSRIPGFEDIALWASYHHEMPDGEGYPFRLTRDEIPFQARILRAADIFQALAQDRPYRNALPAPAVLDHLRLLREEEQLDLSIYDAIAANLQEVYRLAQPCADQFRANPSLAACDPIATS